MRILIVEDQPHLRQTLAKCLREENYAVDTAVDGEEGLWMAENTDYDAIVLDIMLPKMDGWEMLKRLRKAKKIPVLMLTAKDAVPDRIRGLDMGADDYLVKPCDLDELLARLRALIRRCAGLSKPMIDIKDVTLDLAGRNLFKNGQPIPLTAREFALVEFLALRRGEVVSRSMLYEHLMDEEDDTLSNLIDVHIYKIRRKVGSDFVITRRGVGYCIE